MALLMSVTRICVGVNPHIDRVCGCGRGCKSGERERRWRYCLRGQPRWRRSDARPLIDRCSWALSPLVGPTLVSFTQHHKSLIFKECKWGVARTARPPGEE